MAAPVTRIASIPPWADAEVTDVSQPRFFSAMNPKGEPRRSLQKCPPQSRHKGHSTTFPRPPHLQTRVQQLFNTAQRE
jgi:hypothetical protein